MGHIIFLLGSAAIDLLRLFSTQCSVKFHGSTLARDNLIHAILEKRKNFISLRILKILFKTFSKNTTWKEIHFEKNNFLKCQP